MPHNLFDPGDTGRGNYQKGRTENRIQIFNDRGLIQYQEPFTPEGFASAFAKVEADVLARLKKDYPDV
jgi:hypothetical protein